jgi:DNA primase
LISSLGGSDAALQRLDRAGLIIKRDTGGYYDRFRDRIIFPIRDQRGRAIGLGGRVLDDSTPKYLNSPETPVFHKGRELYGLYQAKRKTKELERVFVVEGYMDVIALAQHGVTNAVATLGTAVTPDHLDRLFRICPQLVFCFDGDAAGQKAAWRALEISLPLLREGRQVHFMFMPQGEDPDTFVQHYGPEKFADISSFVPLSDYLLSTLKENLDLGRREDRALLAEKAVSHLSHLPSGALLELLLNDLAVLCQLPAGTLREFLRGAPASPKHPAPVRERLSAIPGATNLVSKAVRLLLHHPNAGVGDQAIEQLSGIDDPGAGFLLEILQFINQNPGTTCAGLLEHWRDTKYESRLRELAASEHPLGEGGDIKDNDLRQEFLGFISKIERTFARKQREIRSRNIGNIDELRQLHGKGGDTQKKG